MTRTTALFSTQPQQQQQQENSTLKEQQARIYEEFKGLSREIQRYDDLYYNSDLESSDYSASSSSPISDDEFDALVRQEEQFAQNYPWLLQQWQQESGKGPAATRSGRVGAKVAAVAAANNMNGNATTTATAAVSSTVIPLRAKRQHLSPMLSLDNAHNDEQLYAWLRRVVKAATELHRMENAAATTTTSPSKQEDLQVTIVTEPKMDGVSLSLRYEKNENHQMWRFQWASTRGDGKIGQDVTAAVKQMRGIPLQFRSSSISSQDLGQVMEVRGEVVLPKSAFARLSVLAREEVESIQQLQELEVAMEGTAPTSTNSSSNPKRLVALGSFSNARNAASGILLRKESENDEEQAKANELRSMLHFYAYDISSSGSPSNTSSMDGTQIRTLLSDWGFSVALPALTTNLRWKALNEDVTSETVSISEDWFQTELVQAGQIGPMMAYYAELMKYRASSDAFYTEETPDPRTVSEISTRPSKTAKKFTTSTIYNWGDFYTDGCVHKVSEATLRSYMGNSMKSPKHAIAHKFPAQSAVTHLLDVIVQVGRTGALTPVAILEPVEVGGVTIQRATLHNFGHMKEVLGRKEEEDMDANNAILAPHPVVIRRAGDVIPQVVRSLPSSALSHYGTGKPMISLEPPKTCPACGSDVVWDEIKASNSTTSSVGQVIRCGGPSLLCPPRAITSLAHAYSRDALDVSGLSEARIQQLMDAGLIRYPSDLFQLNDTQWEEVAALPGWGKKSCSNLRSSALRVASNGVSLGRFMYSLGIRHVGKHSSELVASSYGTLPAFFKEILDAQAISGSGNSHDHFHENNLQKLFPSLQNKLGVGPVMIDSLSRFATNSELVASAQNLSHVVKVLDENIETKSKDSSGALDLLENESDRPWNGFRVVFTGLLEGISRTEAQKLAKLLGAASTPGSVSKSTNLLVFGEKGGKKLEQARYLGVATIAAKDFIDIVKRRGLI